MSNLYRIAKGWNGKKITDAERSELKIVVSELVGYPCKIACDYNDGLVDIHVFSEEAGRVTDWLDLQENGAFGLIEDLYHSKKRPVNKDLRETCEEYNAGIGVVYGEDEDDDEDENESDYSGEDDEDEDDEDEDEEDEDEEDEDDEMSSVSADEGK
jgi:TATA-binding protein-associated factor Taf7